MKVSKLHKLVLVFGLALGAGGTMSGVAVAAPEPEHCEVLKWKCAQGDQNACDVYEHLSYYCH